MTSFEKRDEHYDDTRLPCFHECLSVVQEATSGFDRQLDRYAMLIDVAASLMVSGIAMMAGDGLIGNENNAPALRIFRAAVSDAKEELAEKLSKQRSRSLMVVK